MTLRDTPPAYAYVASAMTRHITPACQRHVAIISLLRHYAITPCHISFAAFHYYLHYHHFRFHYLHFHY
jgi:hypothetical protein